MYKIYKIVENNEIIYVGCTKNLLQRTKAHRKRFGKTVKLEVISKEKNKYVAFDIEDEMIHKYNPKFNILSRPAITYIEDIDLRYM